MGWKDVVPGLIASLGPGRIVTIHLVQSWQYADQSRAGSFATVELGLKWSR